MTELETMARDIRAHVGTKDITDADDVAAIRSIAASLLELVAPEGEPEEEEEEVGAKMTVSLSQETHDAIAQSMQAHLRRKADARNLTVQDHYFGQAVAAKSRQAESVQDSIFASTPLDTSHKDYQYGDAEAVSQYYVWDSIFCGGA